MYKCFDSDRRGAMRACMIRKGRFGCFLVVFSLLWGYYYRSVFSIKVYDYLLLIFYTELPEIHIVQSSDEEYIF